MIALPFRAGYLIAAILLLGLGAWAGSCMAPDPPPAVVGQTDTVEIPSTALLDLIDDLELERDGLRARLEGVEERPPRMVVRSDTVLAECPAAVITAGRTDRGGILQLGRLDQVPGGWSPTLERGVDLSDCDEGWSIGPGGVSCDPARAGHLVLYGAAAAAYPLVPGSDAGVVGEAGVSWEPSFRSTFRVDLYATTRGTAELRIRKGWRLF